MVCEFSSDSLAITSGITLQPPQPRVHVHWQRSPFGERRGKPSGPSVCHQGSRGWGSRFFLHYWGCMALVVSLKLSSVAKNQAPTPQMHFQNCPPPCLFHTLPLWQLPVCKQICLLNGENQVCMRLCQGKEEESQSSWRKAAGVVLIRRIGFCSRKEDSIGGLLHLF